MIGWLLLGAALAGVVLSLRLRERWLRGPAQGAAVLVAVLGLILLLRRPGSAFHLPGYGPRRWHQP
jgi:hypothetical protein